MTNSLLILGNGAPEKGAADLSAAPAGSVYIDESTLASPAVPVGAIIMIDSYNIPDGWFQLDGGTFDPKIYPDLFNHLGKNTLSDYRGRFPRGAKGSWINVPEVGVQQNDAIRNIYDAWGNMTSGYGRHSSTGLFAFQNQVNQDNLGHGDGYVTDWNMIFDASKTVPTDWENRPLSIISNFIIKAK